MSSLFPELAADDGSPQPVAVPIGKDPAGKRLICGISGVRTVARLCGLPGPFADVAVSGVEVTLEDGVVHVALAGRGDPTLRITPCWPFGEARTDLYVGLDGGAPDDRVQAVIVHAQESLARANYRAVVTAALRDPERAIVGPAPEETPETEWDQSVVRTWKGGRAWREFFADKEQRRNFHHRLRGRVVMVEHGDLECHYATQPIGDGTMGFFNYTTNHLQPLSALRDTGIDPMGEPGYVISDLHEHDIIKGGIPKFEALLDSLAARPEPPELVIARGTCPTIVIGDDMRGAIARFRERTGIPAVFHDHIEDGETDPFQAVFELVRAGWGKPTDGDRAGRVNLVGYPMVPLADDLRQLVRALGLTINATLVPEVTLPEMEQFGNAELTVYFDSALYDDTYRRVLGTSPIPELRPPAPYGPTAIRAWIAAIAEATGRTDRLDAAWSRLWDPVAPKWEALVAQADGYRLGFVVDAARLAALSDPPSRTGTPVVRLLHEMGFATEFVCFGADPASFADAIAALDAGAPTPSVVTAFRDPDGLEAALRASDSVAFYSEYFYDKRLTRTGKAQFSVANFHQGLAGAIETIRGLLRVCRLPFYRTYGDYLGQPFGGEGS